jgi:hypothetical protein
VTGFIKGLFGSNRSSQEKSAEKPVESPLARPATPRSADKPTGAFYLDSDEAKGLGDIEYIRTAKKVRRTFPKTVNNDGIEFEQEVSSLSAKRKGAGASGTTFESSPVSGAASEANGTGSVAPSTEVVERRRTDSSLDLFRSMAKDIRK